MAAVRVALAQLRCYHGDVARNLETIASVATEFGGRHDAIVFPELFTVGFNDQCHTQGLAESLNGPIIREIHRIANGTNTYLVVGLAERERDLFYNTSVLVGPDGVVFSYRKSHLWTNERWMEPGRFINRGLVGQIQVALLVCYDIEFPETARAAAILGARAIFLSNANMAPYAHVHRVAIQARAIENQVFVVAANMVGSLGVCVLLAKAGRFVQTEP